MKTIEQLKNEAARYAIHEGAKLTGRLVPIPPKPPITFVEMQMAIEHAIEQAFLAGWQAGRDGVQ